MSQYAACNFNLNDSLVNATVSGAEVFETIAFPLPWYGNILISAGWGVLFRILGYFALRFLHQNRE
jgi:hypothetical protein